MLDIVDNAGIHVRTFVIYSPSEVLKQVIKNRIKKKYAIEGMFYKYSMSDKELKEMRLETLSSPFGGGTWLLDVDCADIRSNLILKDMEVLSNSAVTIYWVPKYVYFKELQSSKLVNENRKYFEFLYAGKLYPQDMEELSNILSPEKKLDKPLMDFVKKNYRYDVDSVCQLFGLLGKGSKFRTTKDIIDTVGFGGNTVDSFLITVLTAKPKTESGAKRTISKLLLLLNDLNTQTEYRVLRNYLLYSLHTMYTIKLLQISGRYSATVKLIPEELSARVNRMKRFESSLLEDINLPKIMNLRKSIEKYNQEEAKTGLILAIYDYISFVSELSIEEVSTK